MRIDTRINCLPLMCVITQAFWLRACPQCFEEQSAYLHMRSSHYTVTHMRDKIARLIVILLCEISVFHTIWTSLKGKNSLPPRTNPHFEKGRNQ